VWGVGCGVWGVGCGMWDVGCRVDGFGCRDSSEDMINVNENGIINEIPALKCFS
jgi:hypothetical protein